MTKWPEAGVTLWAELERAPGRFALLCGTHADEVAADLADLRGTVPLHVGRCLSTFETKPSADTVRGRLRGHPVLVGTSVLFDPVLVLDPVRLFIQLSKEQPPLVAAWPVETAAGPLTYPPGAMPGRDTAADVQGCLLLTTRTTIFADDVPFTAERFT